MLSTINLSTIIIVFILFNKKHITINTLQFTQSSTIIITKYNFFFIKIIFKIS